MGALQQPQRESGNVGNIDHSLARHMAEHWKNVVTNSPVRHEPFAHFFVENIFPGDVYDLILKHKINDEHFQALNPEKWIRADGSSTRDKMILCDQSFDVLDEERRNFWATLTYAIHSDVLRRLIYAKVTADVALRLGITEDAVLDAKVHVSSGLLRDSDGYRIKPHPDGQPRVVTLMFYLPENDERSDLGTSVYEERGALYGLVGQRYKEVYRFPYLRNSLAVFAVNDLPQKRSMHGRELVETTGERNSILLTYLSEAKKVKNTEIWVDETHDGLN